MKIALIGYGKMGKMIERFALERGHEISCRIDKDNREDFDSEAFKTSDMAIEFTIPEMGYENVLKCFAAGVPVVSGTTGWTEHLPEVKELCASGKGTLMWASNYSVGVNIFKRINRELAHIMNHFPEYTPSMEEIHHIHKLDHPSGTAKTLAEEIIEQTDRITGWREPDLGCASTQTSNLGCASTQTSDLGCASTQNRTENGRDEVLNGEMVIEAKREGEVPGIHEIKWDSPVDDITIRHSAKSREGFALGAVIAAEWMKDKTGWHDVEEVYENV